MPIDKGTSKPITQLSSLQINYKDEYSCFNPPIVTTKERKDLVNTDDPTHPIKEGTMVYNSDEKSVQAYQNGGWVNVGGGDPVPNVVTSQDDGVQDNLVAYAGNDRTVKDSGVKISEVQKLKTKKNGINATPLYQLSNLGALQFGSNENTADTGVILVDGLIPVTFQTQGTGAEVRVCTVINGELGEGSSSPSALLEINSTEGGLLHARMTTAQRDGLLDPKDGLEIYNTDTKNLNIRQNSAWVEIKSGGKGNVVGPSASVNNNIAVFDGTTGTLIKDSGINSSSLVNGPDTTIVNNFALWDSTTGQQLKDSGNLSITVTPVNQSATITFNKPFGSIKFLAPNSSWNNSAEYGDISFSINDDPNVKFAFGVAKLTFRNPIAGGSSGQYNIGTYPDISNETYNFIFPYNHPTNGYILQANGTYGLTSWVSKNQLTYSKFNEETNDLKIVSKNKHIVGVNTATKEQRIILDKLSTDDQGHYFTIKDETGNASKNNVVVDGNGVLIDGEEQYIINVDYGCITVCYTGSSWSIISKF